MIVENVKRISSVMMKLSTAINIYNLLINYRDADGVRFNHFLRTLARFRAIDKKKDGDAAINSRSEKLKCMWQYLLYCFFHIQFYFITLFAGKINLNYKNNNNDNNNNNNYSNDNNNNNNNDNINNKSWLL